MRITQKAIFLLTLTFSCHASLAQAQDPLPEALSASLKAAYKTQNAFVIDATLDAAFEFYPDHTAAIRVFHEINSQPQIVKKANGLPKQTPQGQQSVALIIKNNNPKPDVKWSGEFEAAFDRSTGNTQTENLLSAATLERESGKWRHNFYGRARLASEDGTQINKDYRIRVGSDFKLSGRLFVFGDVEYVADQFSGFDFRTTETLGVGSRWNYGENRSLDLRASVGAQQLRNTGIGAQVEHSVVFRPAATFNWQVNDTLTFGQTARSTIGTDVTVTEAETSFKYKINSRLDLKLAFQIEHTSSVPVGTEKLDTYTSTGLTYRLFD